MNMKLICAASLAVIALAGCGRQRDVVEKDTQTVVHDQPVIVHDDHGHGPGGDNDHRPPPPPPPGGPDHRDDRR